MSSRGLTVISRLRWILSAGVLVALVVACPLLAADASGTWDISYWTGPTHRVITLELVQQGSQLSGTATLRVDGTDTVTRAGIEGTATRSGDLHFLVIETGVALARSQEFLGSWYKAEMSGLTTGSFGEAVFSGVRRQVRDHAGPASAESTQGAGRTQDTNENDLAEW